MTEIVDIHGVKINNLTMEEALDFTMSMLENNSPGRIYTPNSEIIMQAYRDEELKSILNDADILVADGAGVVLASRILNKNLKEKVSGIDLVKRIFKNTKKRPISFFILGGKPGVPEKAAINIYSEYPKAKIVGYHHGYFKEEQIPEIIENINKSKAEVLLVGLGAPKQEKWIHEHYKQLSCKVIMGVGGTIDVFAGTATLAPEFIRKAGLEWLYRLIKQPSRYKRMLDLPRFMILTLKTKLNQKSNINDKNSN
ncbi:MAG: WecB/TagA/CpsF family glycosyltransferase [Clostridiaceae bacterium]|nr:WecB/TagA/CpsF family glycosyltransferase [Clostridiaceae bacterium]